MGYTVVKSFERGIDTRRIIDSIEPGGMLDAKDCHVTRGGEIEKRAAFVRIRGLPPNSKGLHVLPDLKYHVWGTDPAAVPPESLEAGGTYHQIPHPDGLALESILCVEEFQTKLYVIAQYTGGKLLHWWGGDGAGGQDFIIIRQTPDQGGVISPPDPDSPDPPVVVDPPPVGESGASPKASWNFYTWVVPPNWTVTNPPASLLQYCWLLAPGSKYKFSGADQDAWSLVTPTGTDSQGKPFTSVRVDGAETNIALKFSDEINKGPAAAFGVKFYGKASGTQLTVYADEIGTRFNSWTIQWGGYLNPFPDYKNTLTGGLNRETTSFFSALAHVEPHAEGDPDPPRLLGTYACAHNTKMYTCNGSRLNFSKIHDATRWDDSDLGAGNIEMDMVAEGTPVLVAMADYQDLMAVFCLRHVLLWRMDPDPLQNYKVQILHRTGLVAPHAQIAYGEGEVMYLDRSGIRSLRVHSGVDEAYAADIGTMIDLLVRPKIEASTPLQKLRNFWAEVEPHSGRLWMVLHDVAFVLSYYPANKVSAWTRYDLTACPVDYMNATQDGLYWRSGNDLMCYAGENNATYDATEAVARIPYVDGGKPATHKNWMAVDVAAQGTWQIKASFDPTQPTAFDLIANITKSSYAQQKLAMNGQSPSVSLEFRTSFVGRAILSNCAVHYDDAYAD